MLIRGIIDPGIALSANRASPLQAFAQVHLVQDTQLAILIGEKNGIINDETIDIYQFFA